MNFRTIKTLQSVAQSVNATALSWTAVLRTRRQFSLDVESRDKKKHMSFAVPKKVEPRQFVNVLFSPRFFRQRLW